jgi:hypothetical protein
MSGLLKHLKLTDDQRVAVNRWKYIQRVANDATGPTKGHMSLELVALWHDAMQGVFDVGLDPADYLRVRK